MSKEKEKTKILVSLATIASFLHWPVTQPVTSEIGQGKGILFHVAVTLKNFLLV